VLRSGTNKRPQVEKKGVPGMRIPATQDHGVRTALLAVLGIVILCRPVAVPSAAGSATDQSLVTRANGASGGAILAPQSGVKSADWSVLPQTYKLVRDPQGGGAAVYGTLDGEARSAQSILLAVLEVQGTQNQHPFHLFDDVPYLQAVVADRTDQNVQAMFSAKRQGTHVLGVVSVSLDDRSVIFLFDRPDSLSNSFPRLRQALAQKLGRERTEMPLYPTTLADGSSISLPVGWKATHVGRGSVDLAGPNGEEMSLGAAAPVYRNVQRLPYMPAGYVLQAPCCDPVRAYVALFPQVAAATTKSLGKPPQFLDQIVEYLPTAWPSGQAAYILSASRMGGRPYLNYLLLAAIPGYSDPWTVYISGVFAPAEIFPEELPTMLRVWVSYSVNPAIFAERLQHAAQTMKATAEMMRATMTRTSLAFQSAHEGWDQVIRGVQTIEDTRTGERLTFDNTASQRLADRLSTDTGHPWVIVPPSRLIPH
jgi:hypothetical protein